MNNQVVWFKRDLRVEDHAPLSQASTRGPCICLYVYEPELLASDEFDASHLVFINQSLAALSERLTQLGGRLTLRVGRMPDVLDELHNEVAFDALWSHQETGNALTYARDRRVAAWAKTKGIRWNELQNHGVVRPLESRDGWAKRWLWHMQQPILPTPKRIDRPQHLDHGSIPSPEMLGISKSDKHETQLGGEPQAHSVLDSFLNTRGIDYRTAMSSPVTAWEGCSRLSTHFAWGNLSVRQAYQATRSRLKALEAHKALRNDVARRWSSSLHTFEQRLRWHCHFIQKLEDEPALEFHNLSRAYDGLREEVFDESRFQGWCAGQTGYPMVDACMRALHRAGWINFRMRAMLVSFASYHLWLHWRPTAIYLARHFLDFEPGIHFSQVQMQSGVTGINAVRIYSPIKQVLDQDPQGVFIRRYCPELMHVPSEYLAEPHKMPSNLQHRVGCIIGKHYPLPIVEHAKAYRNARSRLYSVKGSSAARAEANRVYQKHGSRRRPAQRRRGSTTT